MKPFAPRLQIGKTGPNLPFAMLLRCCSAARQTGHPPQPQNLFKGELTVCGQNGRSFLNTNDRNG
jgi:hypothetical protein